MSRPTVWSNGRFKLSDDSCFLFVRLGQYKVFLNTTMQNFIKISMARRGPISSHIYAMSPSEAITELLALESSQVKCTWEVKTSCDPDIAHYVYTLFYFLNFLKHL